MNYTLITGASSGIGYELARLFAKNRHHLILVARRKNRLQQLAAHFPSLLNSFPYSGCIRADDGQIVYFAAIKTENAYI